MTTYYTKPVKKTQPEIAIVKKLLKDLNIRYRFHWKIKCNHAMGIAAPDQNLIRIYGYTPYKIIESKSGYYRFVGRKITLQEFLSTVFHEIHHILAARKKLHNGTHMGLQTDTLTTTKFYIWKRNLLRAERYCDTQGAKLMKRYFPNIPFEGGYDGANGAEMVRHLIKEVATVYNIK